MIMPEMNGFQMAQDNSDQIKADTKLIVLTGYQ